MRVPRNENGSLASAGSAAWQSNPLPHAIDLKSRSFGQAADNTGPSQESPWTFLQPLPTQGDAISNHAYRVIEIIGTSPDGIDAAIRNSLARAAETTRGLNWFEVQSVRGHLENRTIAHFPITIKVGFRLEDA